MYPYHNTIKKRIRNGELIGYQFVDNYKNKEGLMKNVQMDR